MNGDEDHRPIIRNRWLPSISICNVACSCICHRWQKKIVLLLFNKYWLRTAAEPYDNKIPLSNKIDNNICLNVSTQPNNLGYRCGAFLYLNSIRVSVYWEDKLQVIHPVILYLYKQNRFVCIAVLTIRRLQHTYSLHSHADTFCFSTFLYLEIGFCARCLPQ